MRKTDILGIKTIVLLVFVLISGKNFSQQKADFACPLKEGKIIIEHPVGYDYGDRIAQIEIISIYPEVYSSSDGQIEAIDTSFDGKFNLAVVYNEYTFIYDNLEIVKCSRGQKIKKGDLLGRISQKLIMRIIKNSEYIDPEKILGCASVNVKK